MGWRSGDTPTRNLPREIMQRWNAKLQRTLRERERVYLGITLDELIKNLKGKAVKGFWIRPKRSTEYCDIEHIYDFWHGCNTSRDGNRHGYLFCVPVQPSGRILQTCKGHFYKMIFKVTDNWDFKRGKILVAWNFTRQWFSVFTAP